jgi:hypothetical protein
MSLGRAQCGHNKKEVTEEKVGLQMAKARTNPFIKKFSVTLHIQYPSWDTGFGFPYHEKDC